MGTILKYNCGRDFISTDDIKYTTNTNLTSFLKDIPKDPEAIEIKTEVERSFVPLSNETQCVGVVLHTINGINVDSPLVLVSDSTICNDLYHSLIGDVVPLDGMSVGENGDKVLLSTSDIRYPCLVGGTYTDNAIKITTKITEDTLLFTNHPIIGKTYLKWIPTEDERALFEVVSQERYLTIYLELYIRSILRRLYNKYHTLLTESSIEDLSQIYGIEVIDGDKERDVIGVDYNKFDSFDFIDIVAISVVGINVIERLRNILSTLTLSEFFTLMGISTKFIAFSNCTIQNKTHTSMINIIGDPFLPATTLISSHGIIADTTSNIHFDGKFTPGILPENHTNTGIFEYNIHNNIVSGITYELD